MLDNPSKDLSRAVLCTIAYADIFDYPLTALEIHRYLTGLSASMEAVNRALAEDRQFMRIGDYFTLPGREGIVSIRKQREARSRELMSRAIQYGRILGALPYIRMVALTGSLAVLNVSTVVDFDYMLVTARGRLWTARAFALAFNRLTRLQGYTLCPNLIISESALEWPQHDLYSARELCQMLLITGKEVHSRLMQANPWVGSFLPNAYMESNSLLLGNSQERAPALQSLFEPPLRGKLGDRLEAWEMSRKIARFSKQDGFGEETIFNAEVCQGNFHHHRKWTREVFEKRLQQYDIASGVQVALSALQEGRTESEHGNLPLEEGTLAPDAHLPRVWSPTMPGSAGVASPLGFDTADNHRLLNQRHSQWQEINMTQILLGQSYFLRFDPKLWEAMQPYPPLGTLYAASYLRQHGYEVALFDAMLAESEDEWGMALEEHKPQYAIIYEDNFNYLSKMCLLRMREAAFKMIDMAKERGCTVILCGADATDHYTEYLARGADYCLLGEGEETLIELLSQLAVGKEPGQIIGLASRTTLRPSRRPDITDLNKLPFPAWDLVDIEKYRSIWMKRHGYFSMNMVTTRGCPYHCNWCAKPIWGQRYNSRSPENVAAEMKWIKENFHPDHIWFADDILGLKPGWIEKFASLLREADAGVPFKCLQRADLVNEKTAPALAKAGCKTVWIGAESGSQKILDAMEKGDKVEDIYNAARLLHRHGIEVGFFLQFGYPGETWGDVQKTLKMVRECAPDDIGISVSYPLPGTKFFERVKMELGDKQNWIDSDDLAMLYRGPFPTEFYRVLHGRVHYEFRTWKALRQPSLRGLINIPRNLAGLMRSEVRLRRYVQAGEAIVR